MKMPPRKPSTGKREMLHPNDPHYTEKRAKNNDAVKKSREKTRKKAKETMEKVAQLKQVRKKGHERKEQHLYIHFLFRRMKCWKKE